MYQTNREATVRPLAFGGHDLAPPKLRCTRDPSISYGLALKRFAINKGEQADETCAMHGSADSVLEFCTSSCTFATKNMPIAAEHHLECS